MQQTQPEPIDFDVALGLRLRADDQRAVVVALDGDAQRDLGLDVEVPLDDHAPSIVHHFMPSLVQLQRRRAPVWVAQQKVHAVPDLMAIDEHRAEAPCLQRRAQRPGAQLDRRWHRLIGAEDPQRLCRRCRVQMVRPPSTGNSTPVMKFDASLAR